MIHVTLTEPIPARYARRYICPGLIGLGNFFSILVNFINKPFPMNIILWRCSFESIYYFMHQINICDYAWSFGCTYLVNRLKLTRYFLC